MTAQHCYSRFGTLATLPFPSPRNTNSKLCLLGLYSPLRSRLAAHRRLSTSVLSCFIASATAHCSRRFSTSLLSCFACSQRSPSLRLGTQTANFVCLVCIPRSGPGSLLTDGSALLCCHASSPPQRHTAHRSAKNAVGLRQPVFSSARFAVRLLPAIQHFLLGRGVETRRWYPITQPRACPYRSAYIFSFFLATGIGKEYNERKNFQEVSPCPTCSPSPIPNCSPPSSA